MIKNSIKFVVNMAVASIDILRLCKNIERKGVVNVY